MTYLFGLVFAETTYYIGYLQVMNYRRPEKLSPQHRNENTGVDGAQIFEGQVFMTEEELSPFLVNERDVLNEVKRKGK